MPGGKSAPRSPPRARRRCGRRRSSARRERRRRTRRRRSAPGSRPRGRRASQAAAIARSTASPTGWPCSSLMRLELVEVEQDQRGAVGSPERARRARRRSCGGCSRPVSGSRSAITRWRASARSRRCLSSCMTTVSPASATAKASARRGVDLVDRVRVVEQRRRVDEREERHQRPCEPRREEVGDEERGEEQQRAEEARGAAGGPDRGRRRSARSRPSRSRGCASTSSGPVR